VKSEEEAGSGEAEAVMSEEGRVRRKQGARREEQ
jgi:hypothetical protein